MKKILIRTNEIVNCWETKDACIVETRNGKKWVCKNIFEPKDDYYEWNTFAYIFKHLHLDFICLELLKKGKSE